MRFEVRFGGVKEMFVLSPVLLVGQILKQFRKQLWSMQFNDLMVRWVFKMSIGHSLNYSANE